MKLYCIDDVIVSHKVGTFHTRMFHGKIDRSEKFAPSHFLGADPGQPLRIKRNGWRVPDVCEPKSASNLVVAEAVKHKLEMLPNVVMRPVVFSKLIDFPCETGDFSYEDRLRAIGPPVWVENGGETRVELDLVYDVLPDVPEYHASLGTYYQLIVARHRDVAALYPDRKAVKHTPQSITGELVLEISPGLLRDYPIFWNKAYFLGEPAFAALEPHIDRDYFYVSEVDLNR